MSDTELLPKSKPEPVRRLEVFTGSGRRRIWTAEQKAGIIAESYEGGGSVSAVARRHGLTPQQLFGWRRVAQAGGGKPGFAPVVVAAAPPPWADAPSAPVGAGGSSVIEIVAGALTVRLAPGTDAATLAMVLRAVKVAAA
jgi:transposase